MKLAISPHSKAGGSLRALARYRWQFAMILPGAICLFLFSYMPMVGAQIAFKDYSIGDTLWSASWVGLDNFWFLTDPEFWRIVKNTLMITVSRFLFTFPAPILLALLINEISSTAFKRIVQTITYLPHFVSWIVIAYILDAFLSPSGGIVNQLIEKFGGTAIFFMGDKDYFVPIIVITSIWKEIGWGTIVYLAAITGIDPQMYEAARIEGAGKWAQMRYITLPTITSTIVLMLILALPGILNAGVDQIYPLMNNANLEVSTVLDTYILINGLQQGYYSMASAVGLVSSTIGLLLIVVANKIAIRLTGDGLW